MKFIHLTCLQEWLDSKRVSQKLEGVYSYYWEELVCELCKEPLALSNPNKFHITYIDNISASDKSKNNYLLNFKQPKNKKYMVLESDIECLSKAIHVIVFSAKPAFYIGRRINNDITISDISVSRKQAGIVMRPDNRVFVEDCDSKFGTFVKCNGLTPIPSSYRLPV
jgi:FHA domain